MSDQETRRQMIVRNHESIQRTIAVVASMMQSFRADERGVLTGELAEDVTALRASATQCAEVVVTLTMMLRYAGLSDEEILAMADVIDREDAMLAGLKTA